MKKNPVDDASSNVVSMTKYAPIKKAHLTTYMMGPADSDVPPVRSVELPDDKAPPRGVFVGFYGQTQAVSRLRELHIEAMQTRQVLYLVDVQVKVDTNFAKRPSPQEIPSVWFLNLFRATNTTNDYIMDLIKATKADRNKGINDLVCEKPAVLKKLWKTPELSHLSLIVWKDSRQYYGAIQSLDVVENVQLLGNKERFLDWESRLDKLLSK